MNPGEEKKGHNILSFLDKESDWVSRSQYWSFKVERELYLAQTPFGHVPSSVYSRYSGLWDRFYTQCHSQSPYYTLEMCNRARSLTLIYSTGLDFVTKFYLVWLETVGSGLLDSNQALVLQKRSKMSSVNQKVFVTVLWSFAGQYCFYFSSLFMITIVKKLFSIVDLIQWHYCYYPRGQVVIKPTGSSEWANFVFIFVVV